MDIGSALKFGKKNEETPEDRALMLERAREIHAETIVVDGHLGTFSGLVGVSESGQESGQGRVSLAGLRESGVKCAVLSAFIFERLWPMRGVRTGLQYADEFSAICKTPGVRSVERSGDIEEARQNGEVGLMLGFEGAEFLDGSIAALRMFYRLGLRVLQLTWNERNALADGAAEGNTRGGLTHFGREVLREAGTLGILVDLAHISEAGFWDVAEVSEHPFVVSHANCHSLYGHPRNLTNDQLRAIRDTGSVVGISINPSYMASSHQEVTVSTVCDHIEHAVDVAGESHVALGTDMGSFSTPLPEGLSGSGDLHLITLELLRRGMPGKTISSLLGGNWMRVFRAVVG